MHNIRRIVIKIGSQVLSRDNGALDITRMSALVDQVESLRRQGIEVILVSSGAVASGRSLLAGKVARLDSVEQRQLFSAVGQAVLINRYSDLFKAHGIVCGQVLTTKESFADRKHYLNQKSCMEVMLENGILPIVNENDTISVTELMFTDNDELSGLIATMMGAQLLIMLSNVDGIFNGDPQQGGQLIGRIEAGEDFTRCISASKSSFGRGGMRTKYRIAAKVAEEGIGVVIANGKKDGIVTDIIAALQASAPLPGTLFVPAKEASAVKKWIAHSESYAKGALRVNAGCAAALTAEAKSCSLLPVGVEAVEGSFQAGDIVRIIDSEGRCIGVGKTTCSSETAARLLGKKGLKPFVHYNYLYLE